MPSVIADAGRTRPQERDRTVTLARFGWYEAQEVEPLGRPRAPLRRPLRQQHRADDDNGAVPGRQRIARFAHVVQQRRSQQIGIIIARPAQVA